MGEIMKVACPYCDKQVEIASWLEIYHLERLGDALCECTKCHRKYRAHYDGGALVVTRIGPRDKKKEPQVEAIARGSTEDCRGGEYPNLMCFGREPHKCNHQNSCQDHEACEKEYHEVWFSFMN